MTLQQAAQHFAAILAHAVEHESDPARRLWLQRLLGNVRKLANET